MFINGKENKAFDSYCPANGEFLSTCVEAAKEDVNFTVTPTWKAFKKWKGISPENRSSYLLKIADLLEKNAEKIAMVETMDNGKPIYESSAIDLPLATDHFRYFAGVIRADEDEDVMIDKDTMSIVLKEPIGVLSKSNILFYKKIS